MNVSKDLVGKKIGLLLIVDKQIKNKRTYYLCKCDCGNEKWIRADNLLKKGDNANCGCKKKYSRYRDITNQRFGLLEALYIVGNSKNNGYIWRCKCDCGDYKDIVLSNLTSGKTISCGCNKKSKAEINITKAIVAFKNKYIKDNTNTSCLCRDKLFRHNVSGTTGVSFNSRDKLWISVITFKNKRYYLGSFKDKEEAISARKEAEENLHKNFLENIHIKTNK